MVKNTSRLYLWWNLNDLSGRSSLDLDKQVLDGLQLHSILEKLIISGCGGIRFANWLQPKQYIDY